MAVAPHRQLDSSGLFSIGEPGERNGANGDRRSAGRVMSRDLRGRKGGNYDMASRLLWRHSMSIGCFNITRLPFIGESVLGQMIKTVLKLLSLLYGRYPRELLDKLQMKRAA
jgi:hypothetical protein